MMYGITKSDNLTKHDTVRFAVTRSEVDNCSTCRLEQQINELKKTGKTAKNILVVCFTGYDTGSKQIFQLPEIRRYLTQLFENVPELFYFMHIKSYTFAALMNVIFTNIIQIQRADDAIREYARSVNDTGRVITVSYYGEHHVELVNDILRYSE